MSSNIERYKNDIESLIKKGNRLVVALWKVQNPEQVKRQLMAIHGDKTDEVMKSLPTFEHDYQPWYSEAKALVKQLIPDRLDDFVRHYEKPKSRKEITFANYTIEDGLLGLTVNQTVGLQKSKIVGPDAAIPHVQQQVAIVKSSRERFESSLFDIRQLVQADVFGSELEAAEELLKKKFTRAAGAVAGVVLERHLKQVCQNRGLKLAKRAPGLSDLNEALKSSNTIDQVQWRFVQHLADIRNLCDHSNPQEPKSDHVGDLISGTRKVMGTIL